MTIPIPGPLSGVEPGEYLRRPRLVRLLERWRPKDNSGGNSGVSSLYLRPGGLDFLTTTHRGEPPAREWADALHETGGPVLESAQSGTGVVGLQSGSHRLLVIPPFPVEANSLTPGWNVAPLRELLEGRYTVGVILLRLGRFSVAVYRGEELQSSKTDARYVKGRHRAGGSSARRFERIREGQMRKIYDKACQAARTQLEPVQSQLDFIVLGGERLTLNGFLNVCPLMKRFEGKILGRRLNIRDPKRDTLEDVGQMLTESRVYPIGARIEI